MKNTKLSEALTNCINHCNICADDCLEEDNVQMMAQCIRLDRICADACNTLNNVHATQYKEINDLVQYCTKICDDCAEECEKHEHQHCKECAKACRECAEACRGFVG